MFVCVRSSSLGLRLSDFPIIHTINFTPMPSAVSLNMLFAAAEAISNDPRSRYNTMKVRGDVQKVKVLIVVFRKVPGERLFVS